MRLERTVVQLSNSNLFLRRVNDDKRRFMKEIRVELRSLKSFRIVCAPLLCSALLTALVGCQVVGPLAVQHGRIDYNSVIQRTNEEQMFANMIRIYENQTPAFMDVSEIDALVVSSGTLSGGLNPAGGPTQLGMVSGTLQYEEEPTIRYAPLVGQALVTQVSTPLSVDALSNMINSGWPISAVLDFACDRLVPNPNDRKDAVDAITYLFSVDGLLIGTGQGKTSSAKSSNPVVTVTPNPSPTAPISTGTPPPASTPTPVQTGVTVQVNQNNSGSGGGGQPDSLVLFANRAVLDTDLKAANYWGRLQTIYNSHKDVIVLPTVSKQPVDTWTGSLPVIQTRSALGILRTASKYYQTIMFVDPRCMPNMQRLEFTGRRIAVPTIFITLEPTTGIGIDYS
jgi:hypothetical protein